jgi:hypothetical protein
LRLTCHWWTWTHSRDTLRLLLTLLRRQNRKLYTLLFSGGFDPVAMNLDLAELEGGAAVDRLCPDAPLFP